MSENEIEVKKPLEVLKPLTQSERQEAKNAAKAAVLLSYGEPPKREQFITYSARMTWVDKLIWFLAIVVLLAAFSLSTIRMYHIGRETFLHSIAHEPSAMWAGIFIVVMAEFAQLISALALARVQGLMFKLALGFVALSATALAIVGNLQVVQPFNMQGVVALDAGASPLLHIFANPFAWLEALLPPLITLTIAHVLKHQLLNAVSVTAKQNAEYEDALATYHRVKSVDAELHSDWLQFYANAILDAVIRKHRRSKVALDAIAGLTIAERRAVVHRELQADNWFSDMQTAPMQTATNAMQGDSPLVLHSASGASGGVHEAADASAGVAKRASSGRVKVKVKRASVQGVYTGEVNDCIHEVADGYMFKCAYCNHQKTYAERESAVKSGAAHLGRYCKVKHRASAGQ